MQEGFVRKTIKIRGIKNDKPVDQNKLRSWAISSGTGVFPETVMVIAEQLIPSPVEGYLEYVILIDVPHPEL